MLILNLESCVSCCSVFNFKTLFALCSYVHLVFLLSVCDRMVSLMRTPLVS